ncbi:hypothetical protein DMH04_17785 [Kibdelosporangium aridum]|uniref:V/A-type H+-transporting ATPase subunit E n=1 Tax=Kibdelosporangium aridum TaxID=2030 RepID=A0A428ZAR8_KIBAR|nr:hypothetical protein [Kibdelosporangium aridum]RSM85154.1 hypothetical protein DMH04_17785 [Kibdelosporangium aridum]
MNSVAEALLPVRTALISKAERDADRVVAEAADSVAHIEDAAQAEAKEILDEARARGEADARILLADERAAARRVARSMELRTQRQIYEQLRQQVCESLQDLRSADDYPALHAAVTTHALMLLGPATVVRDAPSGGIVARAPGRYLDYSFAALADQALDRVAASLEELWTP